MSRSIRLIQSIGLALARRQPPPPQATAAPDPAPAADAADPWAERSVTVRAVRRLARGTRPPTHGE